MKKSIAHNTIDRSGTKINSWIIVQYLFTKNKKRRMYLCRCVCGKEFTKAVRQIINGTCKSCGCQNIENHKKHALSKSKIYNIWQNMKNRCTNPNATNWRYYGGRGIKVCDEWLNSFDTFFADMGHPTTSKHSIDRINNEGNYEPSNCRWATQSEQVRNRRMPLPQPPIN